MLMQNAHPSEFCTYQSPIALRATAKRMKYCTNQCLIVLRATSKRQSILVADNLQCKFHNLRATISAHDQRAVLQLFWFITDQSVLMKLKFRYLSVSSIIRQKTFFHI
jgi:hypothetical protein